MVEPIDDGVPEALIDIFGKIAIKYGWSPINTLSGPGPKLGKKVDAESRFSRDEQLLSIEIMGGDVKLTISQEYPAITNIIINSNSHKTVNAFYLAHNIQTLYIGDPKILKKIRAFIEPVQPVTLNDYEWYYTYTKN